MNGNPQGDPVLEEYRRLYPFLCDDELSELKDSNERFLILAFRQIGRLKRQGLWPLDNDSETIRHNPASPL